MSANNLDPTQPPLLPKVGKSHLPSRKDLVKSGLIVLGCGFFSLLVAVLTPKQYRSEAKIVIYNMDVNNSFMREFSSFQSFGERRKMNEFIVANSLDQRFLEELGRANGLIKPDISEEDRFMEVAELRRRFKILQTDTGAYLVTFLDKDKARAQRMLQAVVQEMRQVVASTTQTPITRMADQFRREIKSTLEEISKISDNLVKQSPRQAAISRELLEARDRLSNLLLTRRDSHPEVRAIERRIGELEKQLADLAKAAKDSGETDDAYDTTFITASGISKIGAAAPPSGGGPTVLLSENDKTPSFSNSRIEYLQMLHETYAGLLKKYQDLKLALPIENARNEAMIRVLDEPSLPKHPFKPNKKAYLLYGLLLGMFIGLLRLSEVRSFIRRQFALRLS